MAELVPEVVEVPLGEAPALPLAIVGEAPSVVVLVGEAMSEGDVTSVVVRDGVAGKEKEGTGDV